MDRESIVKICIDDFALKRRHRYGTVMVNIDTGQIVDMIESREKDEVAKWLSTYPNIRVVSRDGSQTYASAITQAHPDAVQVSDRFHILQNLTDCAKRHISKLVSANFRIPVEEGTVGMGGGYWDKPGFDDADLTERQHTSSTERKRMTVARVRTLAANGLSRSEIERETGVTAPTIRKYLDVDFNPANMDFGNKKASKLKPFTGTIDAMLTERRAFKEIEAVLRGCGYDGAASTIRMYATRQRRIIKDSKAEGLANTELIERKWLNKLLYKPIDKVKGITESQIERVIAEYPVIGIIYDTVQSFRVLMSAKRVGELDVWMDNVRHLGIDEFDGFVSGLGLDLDAVKNAIRYEYSNGLAEGCINKVKLIKRIMYGRCSFKLLRNKILQREFS